MSRTTRTPTPGKSVPSISNPRRNAWKIRPNDDVPSDESDTNDRSPSVTRQRTRVRIRKRRGTRTTPVPMHIPGQGGTSWMQQQWGSRSDISSVPTTVKSTNLSSIPENQQKSVKKALFTVPSVSQSKSHAHKLNPSPKSSSATAPKNNCDRNSPLRKQSSETRMSDKSKQSGSRAVNATARNIAIREVPRVPLFHSEVAAEWLFYTVWSPAWDIIWKCDNGKSSLLRSKDFMKLISEVVDNTGPDFNASYDFKVIRVKGTEEVDGNFKIVGMLEPDAKNKRKILKHKPSSRILEQLYKAVVSNSDIIVQCIPKTCSQSKRKMCVVHLTPKNGNKVDFCEILGAIDVQLVMYKIKHEHYDPLVVKCLPISRRKLELIEVDEQQQLPVPPPIVNPLSEIQIQQTTATSLEASSVSPRPVTEGQRVGADELPGPSREINDEPSIQIVNQAVGSQINSTRSNLDAQIEPDPFQIDGDIDLELLDIAGENELATNAIDIPQNSRHTPIFQLNDFVKNGVFVPGPLRPKAKKSAKNGYVYHTLSELANMLNDSIAEDVNKGVVPNMMIKHQCNAYGIVDEVVPQSRHENAYYVRISDETMDSVLLRIHMVNNDKNKSPGPVIDVGSIIRVHRLTVQMEWDAGVSDNTLVLSTSSHLNYVLFEQSSEEYEFYFDSCAKTVTLTGSDMKRVGELHLFKSNRTSDHVEEVPEVLQHHVINEQDQNSFHYRQNASELVIENELNEGNQGNEEQASPSSLESDGVCSSDLMTPPRTVSNASVSMTGSTDESFVFLNDTNDAVEQPVPISNSRSDESFHSASEEVMQPGTVNTVDRGLESSHNAAQEAESHGILREVQSQNPRLTIFHDLVKTSEPVNLLCQIKAFYTSSKRNTYHLLLRDFEGTVPPDEFKTNPRTSEEVHNHNNYLVVNIANADAFQGRDDFPLLNDAVGMDEFYFIDNAKVIGTRPPYVLEVDGQNFALRRCPDVLKVYHMDGSFNTNSLNIRQQGIDDSGMANRDETALDKNPVVEPQAHSTPTSSYRQRNEDEDVIEQVSNPQSTYTSAQQSPCHSPIKKTSRKKNNCAPAREDEASWTGRLRHKRQPREYYQPEKSFEC